MVQSVQSNDQSKKIEILELPKDVLEHILIHLDDKSLLIASHVCKLFASVAESAFARKYAKNFYKVYDGEAYETKRLFQNVMLTKYGSKILNINISYYRNGTLLETIEQNCCNLKSVVLNNFTGIPNLKDISRESFTEFIKNYQQLESLELNYIDVNLVDALDGLNMLKTLKYYSRSRFITHLTKIRLNSLETLELYLPNAVDYAWLLQAMSANKVQTLDLKCYNDLENGDAIINEICAFQSLASLDLSGYPITQEQMKKLASRLPYLTELSMAIPECYSCPENKIFDVMLIFPKLLKLTITLLDDSDFEQFSWTLKRKINEFHSRFIKSTTKTKIYGGYDFSTISFSKEWTFIRRHDLLELYWMENFNERSVQQLINEYFGWYKIKRLKFINNSADEPLDISILMHACFDSAHSLDIISNGPITVNANVS